MRRQKQIIGLLTMLLAMEASVVASPHGATGDPEAGLIEKPGSYPDLDAVFQDENGRSGKLREFIKEYDTPIVLTPVYYECPNICVYTFEGLLEVMRVSGLHPGKRFAIISYSFSPMEDADLARRKKKAWIQRAGDKVPATHWKFLVSPLKNDSRRLSDSIGFYYKQDGRDYIHPATILILGRDGRILRYLYGPEISPIDFTLAINEAAGGKVASLRERILSFCYSFDPVKKKYSLVAWKVVQLGSAAAAVIVGVFLLGLWIMEVRRRNKLRRSE